MYNSWNISGNHDDVLEEHWCGCNDYCQLQANDAQGHFDL